MNDKNLLEKVTRIKRVYSDEELRRIFALRANDALFREIGELVMGKKELAEAEDHIAAWVGYETLTASRFLEL